VYGTPATTFVASFIGSPPMNLMPGQAEGSRFTVAGQVLPLARPSPRGGTLTLGVRPEHAALDPAGTWLLQVDVLEMLGAERLVYGHLGQGSESVPFTLRIDGTLTPPKPGETVRLSVPPQHLHWFDSSTGARVEAV
jgi:sn-glycerol 3-phosphate transport system ATP-binding protein